MVKSGSVSERLSQSPVKTKWWKAYKPETNNQWASWTFAPTISGALLIKQTVLGQSAIFARPLRDSKQFSLSVNTGYGGSHFALFWPWEVSGLLITSSAANLCDEALLLSRRPELLSKCWRFVSVFSPETMEDKMKNRGIDRRHPLPVGRGVFCLFYLWREKKKRAERIK